MSSTNLEPANRERAARMLEVINADQYAEELADPDARQAIGSLVLRSAQKGMELTPASLDYAVETFGRHGLSQEEFVALLGDLTDFTPTESENRLRAAHVALEINRSEHGEAKGTDSVREAAEQRVARIKEIMDVVAVVEAVTGEKMDADEVLGFADDYRQYLIMEGHDPENPDQSKAIETHGPLEDLSRASTHELGRFLLNRHGIRTEPETDDDPEDE